MKLSEATNGAMCMIRSFKDVNSSFRRLLSIGLIQGSLINTVMQIKNIGTLISFDGLKIMLPKDITSLIEIDMIK